MNDGICSGRWQNGCHSTFKKFTFSWISLKWKKIPVILEFILCVYKIPVGRTKKAIGTGGKKRLIIIENVRNPNKNRSQGPHILGIII